MTLAALWGDIARDATVLDLPALRSTIRSTLDDGLQAARYDGPGGRSADTSSSVERQALNDRRDPAANDLALVDHHEHRFVTAVYELATRSHSGPFPHDWRAAVHGAQRLHTMDAIATLDRTGIRPARWVHQAGDAIHDLELIARRHMPREAADWERSWTSGLADEDCCRLCLDHLNLRVPRYRNGLCQPHNSLRADSRAHTNDGEPAEPPEWLSQEMKRTGGPGPDWKKARSRWLLGLGPERRTA